MAVEIRVLGRFAVRRDGTVVESRLFGGRMTQKLIRILAANRGSLVTRDALVDALWDDRSPADPAANLNVVVNRARRALGGAVIRTMQGGYLLDHDDLLVDAELFADDVALARKRLDDDPGAAQAAVDAALARWGEPWPEDTYAEWARPHQERLRRIWQECVETGAAAALRSARIPRAIELAEAAVAAAPLREAAHLLRIRALAAGSDRAGALDAYARLRERLADELGIDPSAEVRQVYHELLGSPTSSRVAPRAVSRATRGEHQPFEGRDRELATLLREHQITLVAGQPGAGKSRLLAELAAGAAGTVISGRAVLPEREHPLSLARTLLRAVIDTGVSPVDVLPATTAAAVACIVPELDATGTVPTDPETARALALEGCVRLLCGIGPAWLLVDDVQWADASSLELLSLVAARAENLSLVLAFRAGEVAGPFLPDLRSAHHPEEILLGPLDAAAIGRLARRPELAHVLVSDTDRMPFAIVEVLRAIEHDAPLDVDKARSVARLGRRRSVLLRAQRQGALAREVLSLLAVLGRPAGVELLAAASGASQESITGCLRALVDADLVGAGARGFAPAHDLVAETVRDDLAVVDLARLHGLLAAALAGDRSASGERASHLAGAGDRGAAAAYAAAARERLEHFANREAEQLAERGLALDPDAQARVELLEIRADTRFGAGDPAAARSDLREALVLVPSGPVRARLLTRLAGMLSGTDDLVHAANVVDLALTEAGDDPAARAKALTAGAIIDMNLEREQRSRERYDEALALFRHVRDARGVADILDGRAMAVFMAGEIDAAVDAFEQAARLFADSGHLLRVVTPRSTRGHALLFAGRTHEGVPDIAQALELAESLGYAEGEAFVCWHHTEALVALGRADDGVAMARRSVAVASRVGHRGWTATAHRALGIALAAAGDLADAEAAFRQMLELSTHFPLFQCWAHSRLAMVLTDTGRLDDAADPVDIALVTGPPLGHYEARLAACTLAVRRGQPDAAALVADSIRAAESGGHGASLARLRQLCYA